MFPGCRGFPCGSGCDKSGGSLANLKRNRQANARSTRKTLGRPCGPVRVGIRQLISLRRPVKNADITRIAIDSRDLEELKFKTLDHRVSVSSSRLVSRP